MMNDKHKLEGSWERNSKGNAHSKRRQAWIFQLNEAIEFDSYRPFDEYFAHQGQLHELGKVLGIRDEELLEDFLHLGFTPRTAPAIEMVPLAFVAWASSSVTDEECAAAVGEVYDSQLREFPKTSAVVQAWLDTQPSPELWNLWVQYIHCRLPSLDQEERIGLQRKLLNQARRVARAAGGWLGLGSICHGEQLVIDAIEDAFSGEAPKVELLAATHDSTRMAGV